MVKIKSKYMSKSRKPPPSGGGNSIPAPEGLTATMTSVGVYLQWYGVPNATSYWICRSDFGNNAIAVIQATSFTDHYPVAGTTYKVAAVVNSVLGSFSSWVAVK